MKRIVFEVIVEAHDAGIRPDADEEENIRDCILDALGFPENVYVSAKVLHREDLK